MFDEREVPHLDFSRFPDPGRCASTTFALTSLALVTTQKEIDALAKAIARKASGDAIVWFAYPKGSSKQYACEFNRDSGWTATGAAGFEPVRMVAIDEDWSALRFRRAEFIKTMTRPREHRPSAQEQARVKR
jgi:hypothetical protein